MKMNRFARSTAATFWAVLLLFPTFNCFTAGQTRHPVRPKQTSGAPPARTNIEIRKMLANIDQANIERTIRKLVSFGTRNSLSDQNSPQRGIGAASEWLYSEFVKVSQNLGGRMTGEKQTFEQGKTAS